MSSFGQTLRSIRLSRGWSLEEMAIRLDSSKQVLSKYENEQRIPKVTTVAEFAKKLGVSIEQLAGYAPLPDELDMKKETAKCMVGQLSQENLELATDFLKAMINRQ